MPQYFGFDAANILLRDVKTGLLFTVNELYYHDKAKHQLESDDESKVKNEE